MDIKNDCRNFNATRAVANHLTWKKIQISMGFFGRDICNCSNCNQNCEDHFPYPFITAVSYMNSFHLHIFIHTYKYVVRYHLSTLSNEIFQQLAVDSPCSPIHQASGPIWTSVPIINVGFEDKLVSKLLPQVEIHGVVVSFADKQKEKQQMARSCILKISCVFVNKYTKNVCLFIVLSSVPTKPGIS